MAAGIKDNFLNHCIGSLSDIALFLRSVQLPIKRFNPSNQHIYIHCSLLQDRPDSFDPLVYLVQLFVQSMFVSLENNNNLMLLAAKIYIHAPRYNDYYRVNYKSKKAFDRGADYPESVHA